MIIIFLIPIKIIGIKIVGNIFVGIFEGEEEDNDVNLAPLTYVIIPVKGRCSDENFYKRTIWSSGCH